MDFAPGTHDVRASLRPHFWCFPRLRVHFGGPLRLNPTESPLRWESTWRGSQVNEKEMDAHERTQIHARGSCGRTLFEPRGQTTSR